MALRWRQSDRAADRAATNTGPALSSTGYPRWPDRIASAPGGATPCDAPAMIPGQLARRCFIDLEQARATDLDSYTQLFSSKATTEVVGKNLTQFLMQIWVSENGNYPL